MRRPVVLAACAAAACAAAAGASALTGFYSLGAQSSGSFASGTVSISDNDQGSALLTLAAGNPGDSATGCITVTYGGSIGATVHVYGSPSGGLAPYLNLTVTRGTIASPSFPSCTGFVADGGGGVLYNGTLSAFPTTYAAGLVDPTAAWATNEVHTYKFVATLASDLAGQGQSASASVTWEARNT